MLRLALFPADSELSESFRCLSGQGEFSTDQETFGVRLMIEYLAFCAVGLFAVGIVIAIVIAEVFTRQHKRAEERREAYQRQRERRIAARRARLARSSPMPLAVADD